jgi:glycosyltransferase involved in cell wall biosynthesis
MESMMASVHLTEIFPEKNELLREQDGFLYLKNDSKECFVDVAPINSYFEPTQLKFEKPVLLVHLSMLAIGGAEKLTFDLLNNIKDKFTFVIVTSDRHAAEVGSTHPDFKNLPATIYDMGEFSIPQIQLPIFQYILRKYSVETLFIANGSNFIYDNLASIRANNPKLHIVNQLYDHEAGWINRYNENCIEAIDIHIACNPKIELTYKNKFNISGERILRIDHGIEVENFAKAVPDIKSKEKMRLNFGISPEKIVVCFIARLHPQKRPNDFLKLAKRFENDPRYFFIMVGDGPLRNNIEEFLNIYNLKNFKKMGFYEPISDILSISDILTITSEYEGLPLVILNALAMSVAVISTDVGSVASVLERDGGGIITPQIGNIDALSASLVKVTEKLPEIKSKGEKTIRDAYDIREKALQYLQAFMR